MLVLGNAAHRIGQLGQALFASFAFEGVGGSSAQTVGDDSLIGLVVEVVIEPTFIALPNHAAVGFAGGGLFFVAVAGHWTTQYAVAGHAVLCWCHFVGELAHGTAMAVFYFDEVTSCAVVVTHQGFAVQCLLKFGAAWVLNGDGLQAQARVAGNRVSGQQSFVDVMQTEPAAQAVNDGGELAHG